MAILHKTIAIIVIPHEYKCKKHFVKKWGGVGLEEHVQ